MRVTLQTAQAVMDPNAALVVDLTAALREIASAARSVRLLTDYLERNPSAVVRGRGPEEK